jgi:hypothetical protein
MQQAVMNARVASPATREPGAAIGARPAGAAGPAATHPSCTPLDACFGHRFGDVRVQAEQKRAETFPGDEEDMPGVVRAASDGGVDGGAAPVPSDAGAVAAKPSISKSGDSYTDTADESHKKIKFTVSVPSGLTASDYGLVNWVKGSAKNGSGDFFKVKMYGTLVDFNFADFQVDSLDADPIYWSDASARRNYTAETGGFSATDDPGPAKKTQTGAVYAFQFKMGVYKMADVPTTTTGSISATAIDAVNWDYSVKVSSTGTFSHPSL